ncbi:MAG TPA: HipA family kinase [Candidatus Sulfotelmatobacter sp.]|nr:HipA family kinase [Candidatus Sulfotelmatobacter sp.]
MSTCISAMQHLRKLRGGSQPHLIRASDGASYVTKFQNNPQHVRVLANEMLATKLGLALGLPMQRVEVIEVCEWLIANTQDLRIQLAGREIPCESGLQLGSRYVGDECSGLTCDYLPRELLASVRNLVCIARVLVLDKWTCNSDGRQAIFYRRTPRNRGYTATFIDQGYCFNAGEWTFPDAPLRGVYGNNCVYEGVTGWEEFVPALSRAEEMDVQAIWRCARRDSRGVVRSRPRRFGEIGRNAPPSTGQDQKVDHRISHLEPKPISQLACLDSRLCRRSDNRSIDSGSAFVIHANEGGRRITEAKGGSGQCSSTILQPLLKAPADQ